MRKAHKSESGDVEAIRVSLVELRRLFQRKELAALWAQAAGRDLSLDYGELRLLDAVRVAQTRGANGATVGDVSRLLGVDPSRASRQVAAAVASGSLERRAAQDDGRKVVLAITARGEKLRARGSELTRNRIDLALQDWSHAERDRFAKLLSRFVAAMTADR